MIVHRSALTWWDVFVLQCGDPFREEDVIVLNGTKEEVEKLRGKMEERRSKVKTKVGFNSLTAEVQLIYSDRTLRTVLGFK